MNAQASKHLTKAKTALLLDSPFFGTLLLRFRTEERPDLPTAATDGESLFYNPAFINSLAADHLKAVLGHEVLHVALLHHTRREKRDPMKWNIAADYAVNLLLVNSGFRLPDGALLDTQYQGMTAEEIYKRLPDDGGQGQGQDGQGQGGQSKGQDPGGMGGVMDAPHDGASLSTEERAQAEEAAKIATQQAAQAAKVAGQVPGGIKRMVDEIVNPRLPWQDILWRFMNTTVRDDYSWAVPNRRYVGQGLYLPSMKSETVGRIVLGVDVSGSIDQDAFNQFAAELGAILERFNLELTVLFCDTKIQAVRTYSRADLPIKLESCGGGGTSFSPVFDYVEEHSLDPAVLIYFTDMECWRWPDKAPGYPVLWAAYDSGDTKPPFGEVMRIT